MTAPVEPADPGRSRASAGPTRETADTAATEPVDELDALTHTRAVGRGLALAMGGLTDRVQTAERDVRAASWEQPADIEVRLTKQADLVIPDHIAATLRGDSEQVAAGPTIDVRELSAASIEAARAAAEKVRLAFDAVDEAHSAVLQAQLTAAGEVAAGPDAGRRPRVPAGVRTHGSALVAAVRSEVRFLVSRKPRKVLRALAIAVLAGAAYLAWIRIADWDKYSKWAPYLTVLFISSVMGTSACFNSVSFDAQRVRVALDRGARLWQILVVKNLALMILVFPLGLAMCVVLTLIAGRPATLLAAVALVVCIMLLWSGVGNLLSVLLPIRDAPLKVHRREGTFKLFVVEFGVTWAISYLVLFLLIWRVYSAREFGERFDSTWVAVLLLVLSAVVGWLNFTVMAVAFANQPGVYRRLRRELDWRPAADPDPDPASTQGAETPAADRS